MSSSKTTNCCSEDHNVLPMSTGTAFSIPRMSYSRGWCRWHSFEWDVYERFLVLTQPTLHGFPWGQVIDRATAPVPFAGICLVPRLLCTVTEEWWKVTRSQALCYMQMTPQEVRELVQGEATQSWDLYKLPHSLHPGCFLLVPSIQTWEEVKGANSVHLFWHA